MLDYGHNIKIIISQFIVFSKLIEEIKNKVVKLINVDSLNT